MSFSSWAIPLTICLVFTASYLKGRDPAADFLRGAKEGLSTAVSLLPALVLFMSAIGAFEASGALDLLVSILSFPARALGIPPEVLPLALLRPVSGSGSLSVFEQILRTCGPDSAIGQTASVIQSATETTFYTFSVYYGAVKVSKGRRTLICSLLGDLIVVLCASFFFRSL